jgi:CheY-like chemotaxis protein
MQVKEKILVVDDEPSIRKYLQTLLEVEGFDVDTVSCGKDAIKRVGDGERPDFIILDVLMPEMGGSDPARRARLSDETLRKD